MPTPASARPQVDSPFELAQTLHGPCSLGLLAAACMGLAYGAGGGGLPQWLQASCIGTPWGVLFTLGLALAWCQHYRMMLALTALVVTLLGTHCMVRLTDLDYDACRLMNLAPLLGGWLAGLVFARTASPAPTRFGIWDVMLLTTFVAILSWLMQQAWQTPQLLLLQVGLASLAGVVLSCGAVDWCVRDRLTWRRLTALAATLAAAVALVVFTSPAGMPRDEMLRWLVSGPVCVIASQATCVLALLGASRLDQVTTERTTAAVRTPVATSPDA
jgi:hypothetical protein